MKIKNSMLLVLFMSSLSYSSNNVELINRINEQDKTIKALREQISKLQKQILELKKENERLKLVPFPVTEFRFYKCPINKDLRHRSL